jgi:hypothetical protein
MRFVGDETDVGVETTIKWHRNHAYKTKSSLSKMNLESIKNHPRTCLKKEQKHRHQPRKSGVILGDISSRLYGFSLCALNVMPTWSDLVLYYWKSWWFYLCLVGDFTLIFVVEQFVYYYSSEDYWLLGLPKSSCIQLSFNLSD